MRGRLDHGAWGAGAVVGREGEERPCTQGRSRCDVGAHTEWGDTQATGHGSPTGGLIPQNSVNTLRMMGAWTLTVGEGSYKSETGEDWDGLCGVGMEVEV